MNTSEIVNDLILGRTAYPKMIDYTPAAQRSSVKSFAAIPAAIPTTLNQLDRQVSQAYDLSITAAIQASIPIVGSVSGGENRRVMVLERIAYKELSEDQVYKQYGYAIRLSVTVNKLTANIKLTLPYLAASAEIGDIEAKWAMQVVGLAGAKIDAVAITPTELNVETFVLAKQNLTALIEAVHDSTTVFSAALIGIRKETDINADYAAAVARTYALACLSRGKSIQQAISALHSSGMDFHDTLRDVYNSYGISSDSTAPTTEIRNKAAAIMDGIQVKP